jgi:hypothetical protein
MTRGIEAQAVPNHMRNDWTSNPGSEHRLYLTLFVTNSGGW